MANLKETIKISQKEFRNQFDKVLLDNPTIHKILRKAISALRLSLCSISLKQN